MVVVAVVLVVCTNKTGHPVADMIGELPLSPKMLSLWVAGGGENTQ